MRFIWKRFGNINGLYGNMLILDILKDALLKDVCCWILNGLCKMVLVLYIWIVYWILDYIGAEF